MSLSKIIDEKIKIKVDQAFSSALSRRFKIGPNIAFTLSQLLINITEEDMKKLLDERDSIRHTITNDTLLDLEKYLDEHTK